MFYIGVGLAHFITPDIFLIIMPPYLPFHLELVYLSGFLEVLFGFLLLFKKYRLFAGYGLVLLLIAVFPANFYLFQSELARDAYGLITKQQAFIRMLFQPLLIIVAYWHSQEDYNPKYSHIYILCAIITIIYFSQILF
tara:strand:- start:690 stop:1103 length:414 start_codon:yes stop_codon:yes gene_type:complete